MIRFLSLVREGNIICYSSISLQDLLIRDSFSTCTYLQEMDELLCNFVGFLAQYALIQAYVSAG